MYNFTKYYVFICGLVLGSLTAVIFFQHKSDHVTPNYKITPKNVEYKRWLQERDLSRFEIPVDIVRYGKQNLALESNFLFSNVTITCIFLSEKPLNVKSAKATWAQGCNNVTVIQFTPKHKKIPSKIDKANSHWIIMCKALLQLSNQNHWFLFIYDTTFVIMENLRLMLAARDYAIPQYLGLAVKFWSTVYNTGKAGYVISQMSLIKLQVRLRSNTCSADTSFLNQEDFYLGKHLSLLNIYPEDTSDSVGLSRFHSYNWQREFYPTLNHYKTSVHPVVCCSSQSISFQAIEGDKMYMYYYLLYTLQIFQNGNLGNVPASTPVPADHVWKSFLKEQGIINDNISAEDYYKLWEKIVQNPFTFAERMNENNNF